MQGSQRFAFAPARVGKARLAQGVLRIDERPGLHALLVCLDARQAGGDQFLGTDFALGQRTRGLGGAEQGQVHGCFHIHRLS